MKPTQQEIIELAREAGIREQMPAEDDLPAVWMASTPEIERLVHLALERFGAGGREPVAYVCPTSHVMADGSMEDGPDYLEWADEASDYEKRVGTPLYTHPSPTDLRAEYVRGLDDAAKAFEAEADTWKAWPQAGAAKRKGVKAIEALKGKQ